MELQKRFFFYVPAAYVFNAYFYLCPLTVSGPVNCPSACIKKKKGGGGCLYASLRNAPWPWAPLFVDYKATNKVMISWLSRTVKHQTKVTMPQQHLQQQSRHGYSPPFSFSHFGPSTETVKL